MNIQSVVNFLVPSSGTTNALVISKDFEGDYHVNFNENSIDGSTFTPYGVYIDNIRGGTDLIVLISEINYMITCPPNSIVNMPYPAPRNHSAVITSHGGYTYTVVFVDHPVQPFKL